MSDAQKTSNAAVRLFLEEGYACSEATALAVAKGWNIETDSLPKAATGFGAGIGRKGSTCGALTGGVIALGLKHGRANADDDAAKEKTLALANIYYDRFESEFGSVTCRELCGCDLSTPTGRKKFKDKNVRSNVCRNIIRRASEILAEVGEMEIDL